MASTSVDCNRVDLRGPSVLIVDGDAAFRAALSASVERLGYRTAQAEGPGRSMEFSIDSTPAVVVLGLRLRDGGLEFLRRLRNTPALRQTPVIVVTAATEPHLLAAVEPLGIH